MSSHGFRSEDWIVSKWETNNTEIVIIVGIGKWGYVFIFRSVSDNNGMIKTVFVLLCIRESMNGFAIFSKNLVYWKRRP